ncbi:MAG: HAD hydrolase-like protein [Henriciella sp.]
MFELKHDTIVFDCDGVILDSNRLKSDAFGLALQGYDSEKVDQFVSWHKQAGGVSRYEKIARFFTEYVEVDNTDWHISRALERFASIVSDGLREASYIAGFEDLISSVKDAELPCSVNTGGDEAEVRSVFIHRQIESFFARIYGSPTTKRNNMLRLKEDNLLGESGVYFGDSRLDYVLAQEFGLHFVFVQSKSEWQTATTELNPLNSTVIFDLTSVRLA